MSSDTDISVLESEIPDLALSAFREAFERARASGRPVVMVDGDELVKVYPDGRREILKRVDPSVRYRTHTGSSAK